MFENVKDAEEILEDPSKWDNHKASYEPLPTGKLAKKKIHRITKLLDSYDPGKDFVLVLAVRKSFGCDDFEVQQTIISVGKTCIFDQEVLSLAEFSPQQIYCEGFPLDLGIVLD